jgi:molybdate-binding protein
MACCDPAVGLIAAELARTAGVRLIAVSRSSQAALALLEQGLVHVAGVHLARVGKRGGNAEVVRKRLGQGYHLLKVARWEEGIALAAGLRLTSIRDAVQTDLRWIGREAGSGARQCLDELLGERTPPRRLAHDHRGVAEAVRLGWADAGVCLRLVSEEAGLGFLGVRQEDYDLCYPAGLEDDGRIRALVAAVRSATYRRLLGQLPGYDDVETGEIEKVASLPGQKSKVKR